jgi:Tol biopolymer transport system component
VFVRDLPADRTILVSRLNGPHGRKLRHRADDPSISGDGRFVVFGAVATPRRAQVLTDKADVLVRDLRANTTTLASRANGRTGRKGNDQSLAPSISGDGVRVAFCSDATNLTRAKHNHPSDVFVRDLSTQTTTLVSRALGRRVAEGRGESEDPYISANGCCVAFASDASNLVIDGTREGGSYLRNLPTHTTTLVGGGFPSSISADGRLVVFGAGGPLSPTPKVAQVFIRDVATQTTTLVSRATGTDGEPGNGDSGNGLVSGDGHLVAFQSKANNLTPDDQDGGVFLRELAPPS